MMYGVLSVRGYIYSELKHECALSDANKALEIESNAEYALSVRGHIYCKLEQYENSLSDLNKSLE